MKQELEEFKYGIKEVNLHCPGSIVFAWFTERRDRNIALKAIRNAEPEHNKRIVRLVPIRKAGAK